MTEIADAARAMANNEDDRCRRVIGRLAYLKLVELLRDHVAKEKTA